MGAMTASGIGISGFAAYLPPYRVRLADWCRWTGNGWDKIKTVVGASFRMRGPNENAYTMAATAVLRLILQYRIDPRSVGFLALGTESSTDNSAGAVIVKGMVNEALIRHGLPEISRACEVPEFKHACLGGVYALKAAARYLALDGRGRTAIVVCSDMAEYERATSGEATQGAGAVAMLVERSPKLLAIELETCGSASAYRGPDFRKPFLRLTGQTLGRFAQPRDFPVFNGKYSAVCYMDEVLAAMADLFRRLDGKPSAFFRKLKATFLHRPYRRMAETGLAVSYLLALAAGDAADHAELASYAQDAGFDVDALVMELGSRPPIYDLVLEGNLSPEVYPLAAQAARRLREAPIFQRLMTSLGDKEMEQIGNIYTASLPAWMAAGLEEAARNGQELVGERILTIGYGSGNAAEIIPMIVADGWRAAAGKIQFSAALENPLVLGQADYETLHDRGELEVRREIPGVFYIDRIGNRQGHFDDLGIEYYRYQA